MKKILGVVILVAVILVIAFTGKKDEIFAPELVLAEGEEVLVVEQDQNESDTVTVSYAKLQKNGYIVMLEQNELHKKKILASSELLPAGEYTNVLLTVKSSGVKRNKRDRSATHSITMVYDNGDEVLDDADALVVVDIESEEVFGEEVVLEEILDLESEEVMEEVNETETGEESESEEMVDGYLILEDGTAIVADSQLEGMDIESEEGETTEEEVAAEGESAEEVTEESEESVGEQLEEGETTEEEVAEEGDTENTEETSTETEENTEEAA